MVAPWTKVRNPSTADDEYWNPRGITVQPGVSVFISDTGNSKVKRLDINNGNYSSSQDNGGIPMGLFYDAGQVWVAENGSNTVSRYPIPMNNSPSVQGVGAASATMVYVSGSGQIYVSSVATSTIFVYDVLGNLSYKFSKYNFAAQTNQLKGPYGMVAIDNKDFYVTDCVDNKIHRFRSHQW